MRRVLAAGLGMSFAACASQTPGPVLLQLAPSSVQGQSIVGRLASIELDVYAAESGVTCSETGDATGLDSDPAPAALVSTELGGSGCPSDARFCGNVELDQSTDARIFVARGKDDAGALFATACASVTLDKSQVEVELVFHRTLLAATCGNDAIEAPETCEGPGEGTCDSSCTSQDVVLSTGSTANDTKDGEGAAKLAPTLVPTADRLVALYTDNSTASQAGDVALRVVDSSLGSIATPAAFGASFFVPKTGAPPGAAQSGTQRSPAACAAGKSVLVAYEAVGTGLDVVAHTLDASSFATGDELLVSGDGATATAGDQRYPAIACDDDGGFVVWRDVASGRVLGRRITLPGTLGRVQELGGAGDGTRVAIVKRSGGFLAAWESGRQIRYRVASSDGTPSGGEVALEGDAVRTWPALASLSDGRVALAYAEGDDGARAIHLQRFDAEGRRVAEPVVVAAAGDLPAVVGTAGAGGSWAVLWAQDGGVQARVLGGDAGFLLNPIASTEDAFEVSAAGTTPAGAVAGSTLAVSWQDDARGIVARLLPLPTR